MTTDDKTMIEQIETALQQATFDGADRTEEYAAAVLPIIRKAERDAAREALDGYADALNRNRSAAVWDWPDFVTDVREWAFYNYPEETP